MFDLIDTEFNCPLQNGQIGARAETHTHDADPRTYPLPVPGLREKPVYPIQDVQSPIRPAEHHFTHLNAISTFESKGEGLPILSCQSHIFLAATET